MIEETEASVGPIDTVLFNLGGQIGDRTLLDTSPKTFERVWRIATLSSIGRPTPCSGHGRPGSRVTYW